MSSQAEGSSEKVVDAIKEKKNRTKIRNLLMKASKSERSILGNGEKEQGYGLEGLGTAGPEPAQRERF